jgi:hypothetical protein
MKRRLMSASVISSGLALLAASTVLAGSAPVQVSSGPPSPYKNCVQPAQPGQNFLDAEVEPQIAVNPTNRSNMIGQWHQDRWSNGGARGIAGAYTTNGGASWMDTTVPYTNCAVGGLPYQRGSDPWVSFGPDGTAYSSALSFDGSTNRNAVSVATSTDGGATWGNVQTVVANTTFQFATDKNSTTADPVHAGTAYTVWDNLNTPTDQPDDNPRTRSYVGPAEFSMTTDGGVHWTAQKTIIGTNIRQQTIGNVIVVDPKTDTLYDFTDLIVSPNTPKQGTQSNAQVAFVKSTDQGKTWSAPQVIAPFNSTGTIDPNTGQSARTGNGLQEVAIDPSNGGLYVAWKASSNYQKNVNQAAGTFDNEIMFTSSADGGNSWSTPKAIVGPTTYPVFIPTIAVSSSGTVAMTYYDSRELTSTNMSTWPVDYWATYSTNGGASFGDEQHVAGPFNLAAAPRAPGFFLGDYEGLAAVGSSFEALFVQTNCNGFDSTSDPCAPASSNTAPTNNTNPTDVFSATLTP